MDEMPPTLLQPPPPFPPDTPLLELKTWGTSRGRRVVFDSLNLTVSGPGIVVLLGPGGTGKSTLLQAIAGHPIGHGERSGLMLFRGVPVETCIQLPALVHQHARDLSFSVQENLAASLRQQQPGTLLELQERIIERLHALGVGELSSHLQRRVIDLPRRLARQVSTLRAAFSGSPLLLIDEPTSELDDADAAQVLALIQRLAADHCCLLTLHNQTQARQAASRIVLLAGGHIQADLPTDAFFSNADQHPVLAQFLRTGSCHVPAPDARPEDLADDVPAPPPVQLKPPPQPALATTAATSPAPARLAASSPRRGPSGFHWLVPGRLAGCPLPGVVFSVDHGLALLRGIGVTVLINLTERAMPADVLERHQICSYHLGIIDRGAPPLLWAKLLLAKMDLMLRAGEVIAVHCLAGLGRTGMVLAAWLIRDGLTADEALRRLRLIEPGFVQSQEQEELLHALEENLLILAST